MMVRKNKNGSTLLITLLISAAIFSIAIGVSLLSLGELKISHESPDSFVAYYAAEAGLERGLYEDYVGIPPADGATITDILTEGIGYTVTFVGTASPNRTIRSSGSYRDINRAVELTY